MNLKDMSTPAIRRQLVDLEISPMPKTRRGLMDALVAALYGLPEEQATVPVLESADSEAKRAEEIAQIGRSSTEEILSSQTGIVNCFVRTLNRCVPVRKYQDAQGRLYFRLPEGLRWNLHHPETSKDFPSPCRDIQLVEFHTKGWKAAIRRTD